VRVAVDYDNHSTPRRFDIAIELGRDLSDEQLQRLEKVAASCPVRRAVEAGISPGFAQLRTVAVEHRRCLAMHDALRSRRRDWLTHEGTETPRVHDRAAVETAPGSLARSQSNS
jgi:hypothetical protein